MKKIFLDTNIILDIFLNRIEYVDSAVKVLSLVGNNTFKGYISSLSCSNIFYITAKYYDKITALKKLEHLRVHVRIAPVVEKTIDMALSSEFTDFEDAVQYYSALDIGCECIVTRNIKDFKKSSIPVFLPAEFLKL